jgi:hypothetical protein
MAKVVPGLWTFTNIVRPSGEKQAPQNSESLAALRATFQIRPSGATART